MNAATASPIMVLMLRNDRPVIKIAVDSNTLAYTTLLCLPDQSFINVPFLSFCSFTKRWMLYSNKEEKNTRAKYHALCNEISRLKPAKYAKAVAPKAIKM